MNIPAFMQCDELEATSEAYDLACHLVSEGFSVFPLRGKIPAVRWKPYQYRHATPDELERWFLDNDYDVAIVTGQISGITVIDCDNVQAIEAAEQAGLATDMIQDTKRGRHYVHPHRGERNTVRLGGVQGLDRRGEGGYVRAYEGAWGWTR